MCVELQDPLDISGFDRVAAGDEVTRVPCITNRVEYTRKRRKIQQFPGNSPFLDDCLNFSQLTWARYAIHNQSSKEKALSWSGRGLVDELSAVQFR